jgi:class 3 adenylate cyclase
VPTKEFTYHWEWRLRASPEVLWPLVSNTNRFNRDTGVPAVRPLPAFGPLDNAHHMLELRRFGVPIEWEEEPFEWVRPFRFGVIRRYRRGPVSEMRVLTELTPQPDGGTRLVYTVSARPRNLFGYLAIPAQIGMLSARSFDRAFRQYDAASRGADSHHRAATELDIPHRNTLAPGGRARLANARLRLLATGVEPALVDLLVALIEEADEMALFRLRPYAVADFWEKPRRAVLELFLHATRAGLVNFSWDLLCPLCRGTRYGVSSLSEVRAEVHCESCNIDFTVNFDRQVELTFRPNPAIRPTPDSTFCVGGPQVTPHIVAQQLLKPGMRREIQVDLEAGRHRLRTMRLPGGQFLVAGPGGAPEAVLAATPEGWPTDEWVIARDAKLTLDNATDQSQLFILERTAWSDQAATAAEVTSLQLFRDLFANEALRPGERISVGTLTVLFTDLRESTRLYRESGDAVAFGHVMNHYDVLRQAILEEDGALVKTIGDAVMAVFRRPAPALRAALKAQAILARPPAGLQPLRLKAGVHMGPAVAVTLNDRLDYFGSTVNITARLEHLANMRPGVVTSAAVVHDPEVAEWLAGGSVTAEPFAATVRGFEDANFEVWSVAPATPAGSPSPAAPHPQAQTVPAA